MKEKEDIVGQGMMNGLVKDKLNKNFDRFRISMKVNREGWGSL